MTKPYARTQDTETDRGNQESQGRKVPYRTIL